MSAYVVSMETISVITDAILSYGIPYIGEHYEPPARFYISDINRDRKAIGQGLLRQNYASVNYRYGEDTPAPEFEYKDVDWDFGTLLGCIECYEYQACETPDYSDSAIHRALNEIKTTMLPKIIKEVLLQEVPWGYREQ